MDKIKVKIDFLHNARPYISDDELSNINVSFPANALPNRGDIVILDGIKPPKGSFVVAYRAFSVSAQYHLSEVFLTLGIEGEC